MAERTIREAIKYLAGTNQPDGTRLIDASVNSVDQAARTCEVTALTGPTGEIIPDVRLMSDADDGVLLIPTVGSTVTIAISIFADPIAVGVSALAMIIFMGGDLGGLVMLLPLITKLNNLENAFNTHLENYNAHIHPVTATGTPTGVPVVLDNQELTPTERADLENTNITQG